MKLRIDKRTWNGFDLYGFLILEFIDLVTGKITRLATGNFATRANKNSRIIRRLFKTLHQTFQP
jgi:hypothetical protein